MIFLQDASVSTLMTCVSIDDGDDHVFFLLLQREDAILREQMERYNQRLREFEEKQRTYCGQQERGDETGLEVL